MRDCSRALHAILVRRISALSRDVSINAKLIAATSDRASRDEQRSKQIQQKWRESARENLCFNTSTLPYRTNTVVSMLFDTTKLFAGR